MQRARGGRNGLTRAAAREVNRSRFGRVRSPWAPFRALVVYQRTYVRERNPATNYRWATGRAVLTDRSMMAFLLISSGFQFPSEPAGFLIGLGLGVRRSPALASNWGLWWVTG